MPSMEAFHNKECLSPPCGRRAALPDDVQRIALLCCPPINKQQTPEKKNSNRTRYGYRNSRSRGVPVKEESLKRVVGWKKKNKTKGSEERTEGGTSPGADNFDSASRLRREYETRRRGPRRGRTRAWSNPASGSLSLTRGKERVVWEREREVGKRKVRKGERERETGRK